jgi:fibronectin-binding autotransporter adhesin
MRSFYFTILTRLLAPVFSFSLAMTARTMAANATWTGATSTTWNTGANWSGGTGTGGVPASGEGLVFGAAGTGGSVLDDNLMTPGTYSVAGITFNSGAAAYIINPGVSGSNGFTLTGNVLNSGTSLETINDLMSINSALTFTMTTGGGNLAFGGNISGGGGITTAGAGTLTLSGTNSYTGGTTVATGTTLVVGGTTGVGTGSVAINGASFVQAASATGFSSNNVINFGSGSTGQFELAGNSVTTGGFSSTQNSGSPIVENAGSAPATVTIGGGNSLFYYGVIQDGTGGGALSLATTGTVYQRLYGNDTYSGGTTIGNGNVNSISAIEADSNTALGTGTITLNDGYLNGQSSPTLANNVVINGSANGFSLYSNLTLNGNLTGSGTVTKTGGGNSLFLGGNNSGFTGNFINSSGNNTFITTASAGSASALWTIDDDFFGVVNISNITVHLGGLASNNTTGNLGTNNASGITYEIGERNDVSDSFAGVINGSSNILKAGTGVQIFTNAANSYNGTTTIENGTLEAGASVASGTNGAFGNSTTAIALGDATTLSGNLNASLLTGGAYTIGRTITVGSGLGATSSTYTIGGATDNNSIFSGNITLNQSLDVTQVANTGTNALSITGNILAGASGTQNVTFSGPGTMMVSGANTYTGTTTLSTGTLILGGNALSAATGALGNATSAIIVGDANTALGLSTPVLLTGGAFTVGRQVDVTSNAVNGAMLGGNTDTNSAFSGLITTDSNLTISQVADAGSNALTISGGITQGSATVGSPYTVTFAGPGNINVSTNAISDGGDGSLSVVINAGNTTFLVANTYTGATDVNGGTLTLGAANAIGSSSDVVVIGGTLAVGSFNDLIEGLTLGTNSIAGNVTGTGTLTSATAFAVKDGAISAVLAGNTGLTKSTIGTVVLTGNNTYTGGTTISGGVLSVDNTYTGPTSSGTGTGAVTVDGGATLGGGNTAANGGALVSYDTNGASLKTYAAKVTGVISGPVTVLKNGILAPGNSVGTITMAKLTLSAGSVVNYEFNSLANDFTFVSTSSGLTINGGTFNLYQEGTTTAFDAIGVYDVIGYTGSFTGSISSLSVGDAQSGYFYTFVNDTADDVIQLHITNTAAPEPTTWAMMLGGLAVLVLWQRRRRQA